MDRGSDAQGGDEAAAPRAGMEPSPALQGGARQGFRAAAPQRPRSGSAGGSEAHRARPGTNLQFGLRGDGLRQQVSPQANPSPGPPLAPDGPAGRDQRGSPGYAGAKRPSAGPHAALPRKREREIVKVVILAGGFGNRLSEETEIRPKPVVEIGGRPILWQIMEHYAHYGFNEFVLALGYKGEDMKRLFLDYYRLNGNVTIDPV